MQLYSINNNGYGKYSFGHDPKTSSDRIISDSNSVGNPIDAGNYPLIPPQLSSAVLGRLNDSKETSIRYSIRDALKEKPNNSKLIKLFIDNGSIASDEGALKYKDKIDELSELDYETVSAKYNLILSQHKKNVQDGYDYGRWAADIKFENIAPILSSDKYTVEDLEEIINVATARPNRENVTLCGMIENFENYENFENLSALDQKNLVSQSRSTSPMPNTITKEEADRLTPNSSLLKIPYISDLRNAESQEEFAVNLDKRRLNTPCTAIATDKTELANIFSMQNLSKLKNELNTTDLTKYKAGFPLEYSRDEFISDFNKLTENISPAEKKKVYEYFQFKIDSAGDIINYPNPNNTDSKNAPVSNIYDYQKIVNRFMLNNKIKLAAEDKGLEDELNRIIKVFPEFISVIGKKQHRGDTIDYHTFDDLKRIMNDDRFNELSYEEKRIMTVTTLFHDFGKAQNIADDGHEKKSALAAKEIIKKMEVSLDEKERIYNLINHSHWLVEDANAEDIAFWFRRPHDFKMAEIFEQADSNSAGFDYEPEPDMISQIYENVDKINNTGIPLFADQLPTDSDKYEVNRYGVRYLDFRDPEASVEKYGYSKGTKVKDLKFLCHASDEDYKSLNTICDPSKNICLSTMLLDRTSNFNTKFAEHEYIMDGTNSNIVIGDKDLAYTGSLRGYDYAKNGMYQTLEKVMGKFSFYTDQNMFRDALANKIKDGLNISKEEYLELFNSIGNLQDKSNITDISLSTGRTLKRNEIIDEISKIQTQMVKPKNPDEEGYTNEFVVYNPKITGIVYDSKKVNINNVENSDIPVVLV